MRTHPACNECGATMHLAEDNGTWWCQRHDPLEIHRREMQRARVGLDVLSPEWAALVNHEHDLLRRRGRDVFGKRDPRFGGRR